jgi:hypothetical protein
MKLHLAALIMCLCIPMSAMDCVNDARDQRLLHHTVTIDGREATIDVHAELAAPVDDVSVLFDVTSAVTGQPEETVTLELVGVGNVQIRPIVGGEGGANGALSGCARGSCTFDIQIRIVRERPDDDAVVFELSSTLSAFAAGTGVRTMINAFSLEANDAVLSAHD